MWFETILRVYFFIIIPLIVHTNVRFVQVFAKIPVFPTRWHRQVTASVLEQNTSMLWKCSIKSIWNLYLFWVKSIFLINKWWTFSSTMFSIMCITYLYFSTYFHWLVLLAHFPLFLPPNLIYLWRYYAVYLSSNFSLPYLYLFPLSYLRKSFVRSPSNCMPSQCLTDTPLNDEISSFICLLPVILIVIQAKSSTSPVSSISSINLGITFMIYIVSHTVGFSKIYCQFIFVFIMRATRNCL